MSWLARLTLLAYPRSFRREYGGDYLRTAADLAADGRTRRDRLALRLLLDALTTGPALRWEYMMNPGRTALVAAVAVGAIFGIVVGAPIVALPLLAVLVALGLAARFHDRPIVTGATELSRWWFVWLGVAAGLFLLGVAMLVTSDDGELTSVAWATWILSWLSAAVVGAIGLGLGAARLLARRGT